MLGNEHIGIIVTIDDTKYYVDCGEAAPFFKSVAFELDFDNVSQFGSDKIQLLPLKLENNEYQYIRYTQGKLNGRVWEFNSREEKELKDFSSVIEISNQPGAIFMSMLKCQLWQTDKGRSVSLANNKFGIRYPDGKLALRTLRTVEEVEEVTVEEFNLPKLPVTKEIGVLENLGIDIFREEH